MRHRSHGPRQMTLAEAKKACSEIGCVLTKRDGEYRVNFRGGNEATAYYTNDLRDAVLTAAQMARFQ